MTPGAAIGIYGVMAYAVTQRTREIGIRMALGAGRFDVMRLVLGQSLALTALGIVIGLGGTAAVSRYLEKMLFGLAPLDPATFAVVSLIFASSPRWPRLFPRAERPRSIRSSRCAASDKGYALTFRISDLRFHGSS